MSFKTLAGCWAAALALAPTAARAVDIAAQFGGRVTPVAGAAAPAVKGDLAGAGGVDEVYYVRVAPAAAGKTIAPDVHVIAGLFEKKAFDAKTTGGALAIVMSGGRGKFLVVDPNDNVGGYFDTPIWSDPKAVGATKNSPIRAAKRASTDLKSFPCLRKSKKGDEIMLNSEAGIEVALDWTGTTFKVCADPTQEP